MEENRPKTMSSKIRAIPAASLNEKGAQEAGIAPGPGDDGKQSLLEEGLMKETGDQEKEQEESKGFKCDPMGFLIFVTTSPRIMMFIGVGCFAVFALIEPDMSLLDTLAMIGMIVVVLVTTVISYREGSVLARMDKRVKEMQAETGMFSSENNRYKGELGEMQQENEELKSNCEEFEKKLATYSQLNDQLDQWSKATSDEFNDVVGHLKELYEGIEKSNRKLEKNMTKHREEQREQQARTLYEHYHTIAWDAQYSDDGEDDFTHNEWIMLVKKVSPKHLKCFARALLGHIKLDKKDQFKMMYVDTREPPSTKELCEIYTWIKDVKNVNGNFILDTEVVYEEFLRTMTNLLAEEFLVKMRSGVHDDDYKSGDYKESEGKRADI